MEVDSQETAAKNTRRDNLLIEENKIQESSLESDLSFDLDELKDFDKQLLGTQVSSMTLGGLKNHTPSKGLIEEKDWRGFNDIQQQLLIAVPLDDKNQSTLSNREEIESLVHRLDKDYGSDPADLLQSLHGD